MLGALAGLGGVVHAEAHQAGQVGPAIEPEHVQQFGWPCPDALKAGVEGERDGGVVAGEVAYQGSQVDVFVGLGLAAAAFGGPLDGPGGLVVQVGDAAGHVPLPVGGDLQPVVGPAGLGGDSGGPLGRGVTMLRAMDRSAWDAELRDRVDRWLSKWEARS